MARLPKNAKIQTREARSKLKARGEPYWFQIHDGLFVGYRRGKTKRTWVLRRRRPDGSYRQEPLGTPDDYSDDAMSYREAVNAAMAAPAAETETASEYTVSAALDAYLEDYEARSGKDPSLRHRIEKHIRPALGSYSVAELMKPALERWRNGLVKTKDGEGNALDDETVRKHRATANKVRTLLNAALNKAIDDGRVDCAPMWQKVKPFKETDAPRPRYLKTPEAKRLVNACPVDLRALVRGALNTGCRYGELIRMTVADFNPDSGTVYLPRTKAGKARNVYLTEQGAEFFRQQAAGKPGGDRLFTRADGSPWRKNDQQRPMQRACIAAKIEPPATFKDLRTTYGATLAMRGVPIKVIAEAMGHADSRITERHYAHLAPSYTHDQIRKHLPRYGLETTNVAGFDG